MDFAGKHESTEFYILEILIKLTNIAYSLDCVSARFVDMVK